MELNVYKLQIIKSYFKSTKKIFLTTSEYLIKFCGNLNKLYYN